MKCIRTAPRRQSLWGKDDSITSRETTEIRSNYGIRSELNLPSGYPYDPEKLSIFEKSNLVSVGNSREQVRVTYKIEDEHMREFDRCMRSVATRMLFQNFDAEPEHILILLQKEVVETYSICDAYYFQQWLSIGATQSSSVRYKRLFRELRVEVINNWKTLFTMVSPCSTGLHIINFVPVSIDFDWTYTGHPEKFDINGSLLNMVIGRKHKFGVFKHYIILIKNFIRKLNESKKAIFGDQELYDIGGDDPICNFMLDFEQKVLDYEDSDRDVFCSGKDAFDQFRVTYAKIMVDHEIFVVLGAFRNDRNRDYCQFYTEDADNIYGSLDAFLAVFTPVALGHFYQLAYRVLSGSKEYCDRFKEGLSVMTSLKADTAFSQQCCAIAKNDILEAFGDEVQEREENWKILLNTLICTRFYMHYAPYDETIADRNRSSYMESESLVDDEPILDSKRSSNVDTDSVLTDSYVSSTHIRNNDKLTEDNEEDEDKGQGNEENEVELPSITKKGININRGYSSTVESNKKARTESNGAKSNKDTYSSQSIQPSQKTNRKR